MACRPCAPRDRERLVLGVQWHAETLEQPEGPHVRLFEALVHAASGRDPGRAD